MHVNKTWHSPKYALIKDVLLRCLNSYRVAVARWYGTLVEERRDTVESASYS